MTNIHNKNLSKFFGVEKDDISEIHILKKRMEVMARNVESPTNCSKKKIDNKNCGKKSLDNNNGGEGR
jgi:hypothetical protein